MFRFYNTEKGLDHVAETILSKLDEKSLCAAELVSRDWRRVISDGMLWKKLIESHVRSDSLWKGLAQRRGWYAYLVVCCGKDIMFVLEQGQTSVQASSWFNHS